jgi:hypothetical protein
MKHVVFLSTILLLWTIQITCGQDCNKLPTSFTSYAQASQLIKSSTFKMHESVNTSKSSWVRGASYYSCDSNKGFLIIKTDNGEYVHQNVPVEVWRSFKNASSFGSYYDHFIKGNYRLNLNFN